MKIKWAMWQWISTTKKQIIIYDMCLKKETKRENKHHGLYEKNPHKLPLGVIDSTSLWYSFVTLLVSSELQLGYCWFIVSFQFKTPQHFALEERRLCEDDSFSHLNALHHFEFPHSAEQLSSCTEKFSCDLDWSLPIHSLF